MYCEQGILFIQFWRSPTRTVQRGLLEPGSMRWTMPYIWLENDELRAVRAVIDWRSRIGQPRAEVVAHPRRRRREDTAR